LIQDFVDGEDLELTILCFHGKPIAGSAYLSIRNAPLPFGPPVACLSIKDDALMRIGCDFLQNIGFHGVAHLDFRRDRRDGIPKLLDFNVRIAGTNDISLHTGVDFGFMLYQLAIGEQVTPCFNYEIGREFRWFMPGELRHFIQTPFKLKTVMELMKWRQVSTDFSLSDPMPQAAMLIDLFRRVFRSLA
jgi:predicted ATP-grasp superfamily ATP-dependent carboligase